MSLKGKFGIGYSPLGKFLIVSLIVVLVASIALCGSMFMGWLVGLVAKGFGHPLPYWPTVGAWFIVATLFQLAKSSKESS